MKLEREYPCAGTFGAISIDGFGREHPIDKMTEVVAFGDNDEVVPFTSMNGCFYFSGRETDAKR